MYKIGVFGDTGMVGQEIEKVLKRHDRVEIVFRKNSKREEGNLESCDLVFLATKDPESMEFAPPALQLGKRVIDMSGAFRLPQAEFEAWYGLKHTAPEFLEEAVYGMPALLQDQIAEARLVANPGCYPTSVILALRPLKGLVKGEATIVATSGNSGARRDVDALSNEIAYSYGRKHKHVPEMERYSGFRVNFTPIVLRSVFKGINANIRIELAPTLKNLPEAEAVEKLSRAIRAAYQPEDLVFIVEDTDEKQWGARDVVDTHKLLIKVGVDEGFAYICSLEDNLGKGAASQAVENMNIMFGLPRLYGIDATYRVS
jgi:N-acetyl-gamma-glutamyl-phosphate reductase